MIYSDIQAALQRRKFKAFDVVLNDGTILTVQHPENLLLAGATTIVIVTYNTDRTEHQLHIVDLDQVNRVSLEPQPTQ